MDMTLYRRLRRLVGTIYRRLRRIMRVRWIVTLYLNFRILPLGAAIKLPIVVVGCGKIKFRNLTGEIEFRCPARFGLIVIGKDVDNMPAAFLPTQIFLAGKLIVRGPVIINQGANVVVWPDAILDLGEYVLICSGVTLKSVQQITIGKYAMISSCCFIMDSNIHCLRDMQTGLVKNPTNPIVIGDCCWLSMNASVMGGARIPSHSVLTRYCFVNKDIGCYGGGIRWRSCPIVETMSRAVALL